MDDLVAFLRERLDGWDEGHPNRIHRCDGGDFWVSDKPCEIARMVAAQRAVVDAYLPPGEDPHPGEPCTNDVESDPTGEYYDSEFDGCERHVIATRQRFHDDHLLRHLAAVYASHPDYRPEWAPDPSGGQ
jgi:hypothetical protein